MIGARRGGPDISAGLCMSPCRSDHLFSPVPFGESGVWSLRIPEGFRSWRRANMRWWFVVATPRAFPADCLHLVHCHYGPTRLGWGRGQGTPLGPRQKGAAPLDSPLVVQDTQSFQHIARFCNGLEQLAGTSGLGLLGLTVIVTAAVHRGFDSELWSPKLPNPSS